MKNRIKTVNEKGLKTCEWKKEWKMHGKKEWKSMEKGMKKGI